MSEPHKKAVVLVSGGLDSTTTLAIAKDQGYTPYAITFDYGQRHAVELESAGRIARAYETVEQVVITIDPRVMGGSALTGATPVPHHDSPDEISDGIPVTYVPARNTIFLSYALAYTETVGAHDIFIGVNALDYSGYPDCRPEYVAAFETMANFATKCGVEGTRVRIHAPLIHMTKAEIIREGQRLGVDYSETHSCYDPDAHGAACGKCDSCLLRAKGFAEAGVPDPTRYVSE